MATWRLGEGDQPSTYGSVLTTSLLTTVPPERWQGNLTFIHSHASTLQTGKSLGVEGG